MTEGEMVGWHQRLDGHEFEQALGDGEGQGSLACCSPWGCRESDTTEHLINHNRDTTLSGLRPTQQTSYHLITTVKTSSGNTVTVRGRVAGTSTRSSGRHN